MPAYSEESKRYHIDRIREVLKIRPDVSIKGIKRALEGDHSDPLSLDPVYIGKMLMKIRKERARRFSNALVTTRLAELEDNTRGVVSQLWAILLDPTCKDIARVAAGKAIIEHEHKLLEAQMNAGIFERKLGTLEVDHLHEYTLAPDLRATILLALKNYGIVKKVEPTNTNEPTIPALPESSGTDHQ